MIASALQTVLHTLMFSLVAGTPLIMASFCCTPLTKKVVRFLPWATAPAFLVVAIAPLDLLVEVPWFFMGGSMELDATGRIFLCLSAFIWLLASFSSRSLLRYERNQARYLLFFLTSMAGNFGLILARGILGYYLFFAVMSFAAYGLVVHKESSDARSAGRIYLLLVMIGEVALFTALIILAHTSGSLAIKDMAGITYHPLTLSLLFIGFGVKVGALPLHGWMMPAYQATPIPAAAALAGSMVNAGILGWLRFLPLGQTACPKWAWLFIVAGALAAVYGVFIGLSRKKAGAVLGASSISQMGLITVIFGMGLVDQNAGLHAASLLILYLVHHSLAKSSLFFGFDLVEQQGHSLSRLEMAAIALPALALAGLPFTSGAISKTAFKELAVSLGEPWYGLSQFFLPITAMGTTMLMLHFLSLLKQGRDTSKPGRRETRIVFAVSFIAVAMVLWLWPAAGSAAAHSLTGAKLFQGLWPVVGGWFLFLVWQRIFSTTGVLEDDQKKHTAFDSIVYTVTRLLQEKEWQEPQQDRILASLRRFIPQLRRTEKIMGRWKVVGLSYLTLCLCLLLVLLCPLFY
ncbi:MAG: complex I subunit 5 family protein [Desulfocapsa sp.]|nr:complex I subunit 5 family protein [Desulfocapsa sp.]